MNIKHLAPIAVLGLAVFAAPASAQLLGGGLHGTLDGGLRGGAEGGLIGGGARGSGGLQGGLDGDIRDIAGSTREAARGTAGKARKGARNTAQRTRDSSAVAAAAARSKVEEARESISGASGPVDGSVSAAAQTAGPRGNAAVTGRGDTAFGRDGLVTGGDLTATGELSRNGATAAPAEQSSSGD